MAMPKKNEENTDIVDFVAEAEKEAEATGEVSSSEESTEEVTGEIIEGELVDNSGSEADEQSDEVITGIVEDNSSEENYDVTDQALASPAKTGLGVINPTEFLAEQGFTDLKIDFTSFPIVKLEDERFQTADNTNFATEFQCQIIQERKSFMFIGDLGRDKDPEIVYSDDGVHQSGDDQKPMVDFFADWKARGIPYSRKEYKQVMVKVLSGGDGSLDEEIVMLQIPPKSIGKVDGYKIALSMRTPPVKVSEAVTKVTVLPKVGTGLKAFNPWGFKFVGKIA